MIPYILTDQSVTLMLGTKPAVIPASHAQFEKIREALRDGVDDVEFFRSLVDVKEAVVRYMQGHIVIEDGVLKYQDRPIDTYLTRKILAFLKSGEDGLVAPLVAFLERLQGNPSFRAQQQLYQWVEKANLPITPDGFILAFKRVRKDYWDHNTGNTFFHKVGAVLEMPRSECDEDPDRTCSSGIHFCSIEYLKKGPVGDSDDPVMIVKIDPADVTAIPRDYNDTKGRCCRMEIVDETSPIEIEGYFGTTTVFYGTEETKTFRYWPGQTWETGDGTEVQLLPGTTEDKAVCLAVKTLPGLTEEEFMLFKFGENPNGRVLKNTATGAIMDPKAFFKHARGTPVGKGANFNYWYSGSLSTVGGNLGWTSDEMWEAVDRYRARFPLAEKWRVDTQTEATEYGFVTLPDGHRRTRFEATQAWASAMRHKFAEIDASPSLGHYADLAIRRIQRTPTARSTSR